MSLEDKLAENTAALLQHTAAITTLSEIMTKHNELLGGLAAKTTGAASTNSAASSSTSATTTPKKETAAEKKAREKAEAEATSAAKQASTEKPAEVTLDTARTLVGDWVGSSAKGSAEAVTKRDEVKKLLSHFSVERVTELPAEKVADFVSMFTQIKNGEDPYPVAEEPETEGGEDPLL